MVRIVAAPVQLVLFDGARVWIYTGVVATVLAVLTVSVVARIRTILISGLAFHD